MWSVENANVKNGWGRNAMGRVYKREVVTLLFSGIDS